MPSEKPRVLYRGHFIPQKRGDILEPNKVDADTDAFVYASEDKRHAAAYGFKKGISSIGFVVIDGDVVPLVFLCIKEDKFRELCRGETSLQKLNPENFKGEYSDKPREGEIASQWVSSKKECVGDENSYPNEDVLNMGVQVFRTENREVFDRVAPQKGRQVDFTLLKHMVSSGDVIWENLHPRFDDIPSTRIQALMKIVGVTVNSSFRPKEEGGASPLRGKNHG